MSSSTPFALSLPARADLVDDVYEAIKAWIMDSVQEPGVRANIDALARSLQVSPTPVREALARLDAEGFVVKERSKGYTVVPPLTEPEVADLYEFRLLLEPWAAGRAAERCDASVAEALRAELATCADPPDDLGYAAYRAVADHDERFHDLILSAAGNVEARRAFARTHCHVHLFRLSYGRGMGMQAIAEHRTVADAITAGDVEAAAAAMRTHLQRSSERIRAVFT